MATTKAQYDAKSKAEMFYILRREIFAARLKVTLDTKLGRPTSEKVRRLAAMDLPRSSEKTRRQRPVGAATSVAVVATQRRAKEAGDSQVPDCAFSPEQRADVRFAATRPPPGPCSAG